MISAVLKTSSDSLCFCSGTYAGIGISYTPLRFSCMFLRFGKNSTGSGLVALSHRCLFAPELPFDQLAPARLVANPARPLLCGYARIEVLEVCASVAYWLVAHDYLSHVYIVHTMYLKFALWFLLFWCASAPHDLTHACNWVFDTPPLRFCLNPLTSCPLFVFFG